MLAVYFLSDHSIVRRTQFRVAYQAPVLAVHSEDRQITIQQSLLFA